MYAVVLIFARVFLSVCKYLGGSKKWIDEDRRTEDIGG